MTVRAPDAREVTERLLPHLVSTHRGARLQSLERLPSGLSGITYVATLATREGAQRLVVKVAPAGVEPTKNRDVLGQARVLTFLAGEAGVPVPTVVCTDPGNPPRIPPFYVTDFVDGVNSEPLDEDDTAVPPEAVLARRYLHAAEVLGRLHRAPVDGALFDNVPLHDPAAELDRWQRVFGAVPEELRFHAATCGRLLAEEIPAAWSYALTHGDFRLGNTICNFDRVAAVIDWELWGLGDPRCDLAWLLHMSDPTAQTARRRLHGIPSRAELVAAYVRSAGHDVADMHWFHALALYKRAAATALIVKHNRRAARPEARKEQAVEVIEPLLDAAEKALGEGE